MLILKIRQCFKISVNISVTMHENAWSYNGIIKINNYLIWQSIFFPFRLMDALLLYHTVLVMVKSLSIIAV